MSDFPDPLSFDCVHDFFAHTADVYPERAFVEVLAETSGIYGITAGEISYRGMSERVSDLRERYRSAGYGVGHRVGMLLENRPSFFEHWFALNGLGVSIVPVNPDLRSAELEYLINHSEMSLAIAISDRQADMRAAGAGLAVIGPDDEIPEASTRATIQSGTRESEAALLYTSGTTGLPKGCVLSNTYFLNCGSWYRNVGGHCAIGFDEERMLTPLPLFHMNALACSSMAMVAVGGCLIVLDRFHPGTWWQSVKDSKATVVHYLGVMPALLMNAPVTELETDNSVRFGFGAGVDKKLHGPSEERFGFPLIEGWAMTETGNGGITVCSKGDRHVGTSNIGAPEPEVAVRIENDAGGECGIGEPGELLVRRNGPDPKFGFFDRYLKDEEATSEAWRDGWFHTGDIVAKCDDGTMVFVDRKKNVIRRSGENIAAVEVESILNRHPGIEVCAVAATPDPIRGDEVFACIIRADASAGTDSSAFADALMQWCQGQMAYYKAPGYIALVDKIPLTSTNKIQRGELRKLVENLRNDPGTIDARRFKKRTAA